MKPLSASNSHTSPVASAAAWSAPGVTTAVCTAWMDAAAPMAFMGWTGMGVR